MNFFKRNRAAPSKLNLCSGSARVPGYLNIDVDPAADLRLDLAKKNLPFPDNSMQTVVCMSAINYFTHSRAQELVCETYRVLARGGVARFGVQDFEIIARKYVAKDHDFFFQKLADGRERFKGETMMEKINEWFSGYPSYGNRPCRYVYDFDSLALLFRRAGFSSALKKDFQESRLAEVAQIDNRSDQMFFLEAVK